MAIRLIPHDPTFFELFAASAQQIVEGSRELTRLLGADAEEREAVLTRMHEIEAAADDATHAIVRRVAGSFVTPFDRADMHRLAVALDNCVDLMEGAVDVIVLYQVDTLLPRVTKQVEIIARIAELTADAMPRLLGADAEERDAVLTRMHEIEAAADEATHAIVRRVGGSFVTPFDRADMHSLAVALDNCVDLMEGAVDVIVLYQVDALLPRVTKQVEIIARMAELTADAMPRLRSMRDLDGYWIEINRLEHRANKQYRRMVAELFNAKKPDPVAVLKHKDIIDALEATANAFEQVALKIEAIAVRES